MNTISRNDILLNSIWTEGKLLLDSPFFNKKVVLMLYTSPLQLKYTEHIISDKMVASVQDFLNLTERSRDLMERLLYQHCLECCEYISYGFDILEGETEQVANLRTFGIKTPEDAFSKANLVQVSIEEDSPSKHRFVRMLFYPEWETEHGCELILKNGELLDFCGEGNSYLGQFE
jgi:hypothetical protein